MSWPRARASISTPGPSPPAAAPRGSLAKAVVLLHQTDDEPAYDLYVDRSYAEYLWLWLEDAAQSMLGDSRVTDWR